MSSHGVVTNSPVLVLGSQPTHDDTGAQEFVAVDIYVTTWARKLAETVMDLTFCFIISLVGVVANFLIIMVFAKQKFKDSVAVSMTAIAAWDFVKCLGCALQRLSGPISLCDPAQAESWANISVVVFTYYSCFATYVSIVLAAYVAVERCLCVSMPFKAKWLITPKGSFVICSVISVIVFGWFSVMFCIYEIKWVHSQHYNQNIAIYATNDFFHQHKQPVFLFYNLSGIILPVVCFMIIVASTCIIFYHLRKSSHFRAGSVQHSEKQSQNRISNRDRQVVKMLLVVISVYVICLTPRITHYLAKYFVYDFYFLRRLHNLFMIMAFVVITLDLINASINLFIFLPMSSSFRATFLEILPLCNRLFPGSNLVPPAERPSQRAKIG
ncbi:hypothetical protein BsWGS_21844 [Bradybaena similaris]